MTWVLVSAPAHVSYYREESAFVPMSLLVRRLPAALAGTLVALTALVSVPIAILYVRGELP